jgi:hypothetical protein
VAPLGGTEEAVEDLCPPQGTWPVGRGIVRRSSFAAAVSTKEEKQERGSIACRLLLVK